MTEGYEEYRLYLRHSPNDEWIDITEQCTLTYNDQGMPAFVHGIIHCGPQTETKIVSIWRRSDD